MMKKDAFPKYEKLTITNLNWINFLATKWTIEGGKTFGIPGQPPLPT
jgi:hypothetical protein